MKEYNAYKIATDKIEKMKVRRGFFVKGQLMDTLNWEHIREFSSLEAAVYFAKSIANGKRIYGPDGRGV